MVVVLLLSFVIYLIYIHLLMFVIFFFFKQKTAYEMRISDWSSDVCSSDLVESSEACAFNRLLISTDVAARPPCAPYERAASRMEIGRASCRERVCQYV